MDVYFVSAVLVATLVLLITERLPVDLTAIGVMVALALGGVLSPVEAAAGFANPAVITVGAMFIVSRAMMRTGAVGFIGARVIQWARGSERQGFLLVLGIVALASAFINNTPVVVLFIPVVMSLGCQFGQSPSRYLIPLSYASILAGTCTLIGTSTNIIVSDLSAGYGFGPLGMFELARLGVPIALVGLAFVYFVAPRLMPDLAGAVCEQDAPHRRYLAELSVPRGSPLVGLDPREAFAERFPRLEIVELVRYSHVFVPGRDPVVLAADDLLLVKASANDLVTVLHDYGVALPPSQQGMFDPGRTAKEALIVELIIPPGSSLQGQRLMESRLLKDPGMHVIAIRRSRLHYTEQNMRDVRLKTGDILLVRCAGRCLEDMRGGGEVIVVEDVHHEIVHTSKALRAGLIFFGLVLAATTGLADIMVCALAAVFLMIGLGCIQLRDAYRAMQADVLMLIAGTIALGAAMEKTGASRLYAELFLEFFAGMGPSVILGAFILLTSISTQILSNNATAVLLMPIAVSTAAGLGVDPKPFIMAVCFGASACFATPIGYQTNLLVYGPGNYRFSDFLKLGIPLNLNLIVLAMGTAFIPLFWPF